MHTRACQLHVVFFTTDRVKPHDTCQRQLQVLPKIDPVPAAVALYCFLGLIMDGSAFLAKWLIGLNIAPHFDQPYFASSLSDWWSRRWNLTVGNCLRFLIYDPIAEGRKALSTSAQT